MQDLIEKTIKQTNTCTTVGLTKITRNQPEISRYETSITAQTETTVDQTKNNHISSQK